MAAVSRTFLHEVSKVVDISVGAGFDPHPELSHFQSLDMDDMDMLVLSFLPVTFLKSWPQQRR